MFSRLFLLFAAVILLIGCGGGGSRSVNSSTLINNNVKILESDGSINIDPVSPNSLHLSGNIPDLKAGDVLVSGSGHGMLKRIKNITRSRSDDVLLETEPGTIEDVFANAQVAVVKAINSYDIESFSPDISGISLVSAGTATTSRSPMSITLKFDKVSISGIILDGSLEVGLSIDAQLRLGLSKLEYARFVPTFGYSGNLRITGKGTATARKRLCVLRGSPIVVMAGFVPVVLVPEVSLYAKGSVSIGAGLDMDFVPASNISYGTEFSGGDWHVVRSYSQNYQTSPRFSAIVSGDIDLCPFVTEWSLLLYDTVGPYVSIEPGIVGEATAQLNPPGVNLKLAAKVGGSTGVKVEALGKQLVNREFPASLEFRYNFFDRFYPIGTVDTRTEVMIDNNNVTDNINGIGFYKWGTPSYWHSVSGYGINGSMLWTRNNNPPQHPLDNVGQWRPNLTGAGLYEIFVYIPRNYATTSNANYEVWISGNYTTSKAVNQYNYYDEWVSLGMYELPNGGSSFIRILDTTNEVYNTKYIGVDAVKFVPR